MRYLLDTHIILWALSDDVKLPSAVRTLLRDPSLESLRRREDLSPHNDPFDRIMLAQAKAEGFVFVTHDSLIPGYNEPCVMAV